MSKRVSWKLEIRGVLTSVLVLCVLSFLTLGAEFDASAVDIYLSPSSIYAGDTTDIKAKFKNLSSLSGPYGGEATFDIRIRMTTPGGSTYSSYIDNWSFNANQTKTATWDDKLFSSQGTYSISAEIYDITGMQDNWSSAHRYDARTEYFTIQSRPTSSINSVSYSPSDETQASVGQAKTVTVSVGLEAEQAGVLQVWMYGPGSADEDLEWVYIPYSQSTVRDFELKLTETVSGSVDYSTYIQFRPGISSGPIQSSGINDVIWSDSGYTIHWEGKPDLKKDSHSISHSTAYAGDTIEVDLTVENDGGAYASYSYVYYYWKRGSADYSGEYRIRSDYVPGLAAGGASADSFEFTIPESTSPGTHTLYYWIDATGRVDESDEGNNRKVWTVEVVGRTRIFSVDYNPADGSQAVAGGQKNVTVSVGVEIWEPGVLQVWMYDSDHSTSVKDWVYISSSQSTIRNFEVPLLETQSGRRDYSTYVQFRPGATFGPLNSTGSSDTTWTGTGYTVDWIQEVGSLRITIVPSGAVFANAKWRLTTGPDTSWNESGTIANDLPVGIYAVEFADVPGWIAAAEQDVEVRANQTVWHEAEYTRFDAPCDVEIVVSPSPLAPGGTGELIVTVIRNDDFWWLSKQSIVSIDSSTTTGLRLGIPKAEILLPVSVSPSAGTFWMDYGEYKFIPAMVNLCTWFNRAWLVVNPDILSIALEGISTFVTDYDTLFGQIYRGVDVPSRFSSTSILPAVVDVEACQILGFRLTYPITVLAQSDWSATCDLHISVGMETVSIPRRVIQYGVLEDHWIEVRRANGSVTMDIDPESAVASGAKWQVVDSSGEVHGWFDSGYTAVGLAVGPSVVSFKNVDGWTSPDEIELLLSDSTCAFGTGTYVREYGSLTVEIQPRTAIDAGAKWRIVDSEGTTHGWYDTGFMKDDLPAGPCQVEFKAVEGWTAPGSIDSAVIAYACRTDSGVYIQEVGSLAVSIGPQEAVQAGAQWKVTDSSGQTHGWFSAEHTEDELPAGICTVAFKSIDGWFAPQDMEVEIPANDTRDVSADYEQDIRTGNLQITLSGANGESRSNAVLVLFDAQYAPMGESYNRTTDGQGMTRWLDLPVGEYNVEAYYEGDTPFTEGVFWASQAFDVYDNETTSKDLLRNRPHAVSVRFLDEATGSILDPSSPVSPGARVRAEVTVRNGTSEPQDVRVGLIADRDRSEPYQWDAAPSHAGIGGQSTQVFSFSREIAEIGVYEFALLVETYVYDGYTKTDAWDWGPVGGAFNVQEARGDLQVQLLDTQGRVSSNATLVLFDAQYQPLGETFNRVSDAQGEAKWEDLLVGSYYVEAYQSGPSPFPGSEYWVNGLVNVAFDQTAKLILRRSQPFASQLTIRDSRGRLLNSANSVIDTDEIVTLSVQVSNRTSNDLDVKLSVLLDRDQQACWDIGIGPSVEHQIPAGRQRTIEVGRVPVRDMAVGLDTYSAALLVETMIEGKLVKTDGWDWSARFRLADALGSSTVGSSLSAPEDPTAAAAYPALREDFNDATWESRWIPRSTSEPGGPGPQLWLSTPEYLRVVEDLEALDRMALRMTVTRSGCGEYSTGAQIDTKRALGYGTYTVRLRTEGPPGFVVGAFPYAVVDVGQYTEIDFELLSRLFGSSNGALFCNTWQDSTDSGSARVLKHVERPTAVVVDYSEYHTYSFHWTANRVAFYVDNGPEAVAIIEDFIPWHAAPFLLNIWSGSKTVLVSPDGHTLWDPHNATENALWSGMMAPGSMGVVYVDYFEYVPENAFELVIEEETLRVNEGETEQLGVRLSGPPSAEVSVVVNKVGGGDPHLTLTGETTLTFTAANWQNYQYVEVNAGEDEDAENGKATFRVSRISGDAVADKDIVVSEKDNEGFTDDVEGGVNGWEATGTRDVVWQITERRGDMPSPTHAWWFGDAARGDYYNRYENSVGTLTSPEIAVEGGALIDISFKHWRHVESYTGSARDVTTVLMSYDGGMFEEVWSTDSRTQSGRGWVSVLIAKQQVPMNASTMQLQFKFDSKSRSRNNYEGWYVDDIQVMASPLELVIEEETLRVNEGETEQLGVRLSGPPSAEVSVVVNKVGGGDPHLTLTGETTLTFTAANWQNYQYVEVNAGEDEDAENGKATFRVSRISGDAVADKDIVVSEKDNEGFTDDVEGGVNGWEATGTRDVVWQITERRGDMPSPTHAWWFGDAARGDYYNRYENSVGTLTSPEIAVEPGRIAELSFTSWRSVERYNRSDRDVTVVLVSYSDGPFTVVWQKTSKDLSSRSWTLEGVRLPIPRDANSVRIQFRFDSRNRSSNTNEGWYVDDIRVISTGDSSEEFTPQGTALECVVAPSPFDDSTTFYTQGANDVEAIQVTVFDLSAHILWMAGSESNLLIWDGRDLHGRRLANGPYMYVLELLRNGQWTRFPAQLVWIYRSDR